MPLNHNNRTTLSYSPMSRRYHFQKYWQTHQNAFCVSFNFSLAWMLAFCLCYIEPRAAHHSFTQMNLCLHFYSFDLFSFRFYLCVRRCDFGGFVTMMGNATVAILAIFSESFCARTQFSDIYWLMFAIYTQLIFRWFFFCFFFFSSVQLCLMCFHSNTKIYYLTEQKYTARDT